jgi:dolichol-phosphate mannosyltransferase
VHPDQVTVVIPTYNEGENLAHLVAAVALGGYRILVVDDNSPDGTGVLAERLRDELPSLGVLHRPAKAGLGRAYAAGFERALSEGAKIVVQMDADFSHNPEDVPRLVAALEAGADLAIGSRYVAGGATPDWPLLRRLISRGGNLYARAMLPMSVRDATAGFRAWNAEALSRIPYRDVEASGYGFQVEMAMHAVDSGLLVVEVPIVFRDRTMGESKMGAGIVLEAMRLVTQWGLRRRLGRKNR